MTIDTLLQKASALLHLQSFAEKTDAMRAETEKRSEERAEIDRLHSFLSHNHDAHA